MQDIFNEDYNKKLDLVFLGIFTLFFGFLYLMGEPIYVGDTFQYENQMVMREPVYALLIQFLRFISPQRHYWILIALQNILAIVTNTTFIILIRRRFTLNALVSFVFVLIQIVPHIMVPVFATTHIILTNTLMTEGILFSLYPIAFMCLVSAIESKKIFGKKSIETIILFLFISLIRGQMMVMLVVWFVVMTVMEVVKYFSIRKGLKKMVKQIFLLLLALIIVFAARTIIVRVYNYCESGLFVDTASGKAMSFANVLYVTDREDGNAIEEERLRALFYEMYDAADADKMNYKYAGDGILNKAAYHELCHEALNFTYFGEPAKRYVGETKGIYVDRYEELMVEIDKVASELSSYLMPRVIFKYARNYICIIALGFIRSVAYEHRILAWYTIIIYLLDIVLTVFLWCKLQESKAALFMAVVLLTIVGNVCATALMIQCISRYMLYNLPLFYMAGILELIEVVRFKDGGRNGI